MAYFTLREVAEELNLSTASIRRYIKNGSLPAIKTGKEYRIEKTDLKKYLSEKVKITPSKIPNNSDSKLEPEMDESKSKDYKLTALSGINSKEIEAIAEISGRNLTSEIVRDALVDNKLYDYYKTQRRSYSKVVSLQLLFLEDAKKRLESRQELIIELNNNKAFIIFPLPPHILDSITTSIEDHFVYSAELNLPPHLRAYKYKSLDESPLSEIANQAKNAKIIVTEVFISDGEFFTRKKTADLLSHLQFAGLSKIYFHSIPHVPPNSDSVKIINIDSSNIDIELI